MINAAGMGVGFTIGLLALGVVREILGAGSLFGVALFGAGFQPWVIMVLPPGGFFVLGAWLLLFSWWARRKAVRPTQEAAQHV
jgi:electron transport complex protein RnfE